MKEKPADLTTVIMNQAVLSQKIDTLAITIDDALTGKKPCALAVTVARLNGKFKACLIITVPVIGYVIFELIKRYA